MENMPKGRWGEIEENVNKAETKKKLRTVSAMHEKEIIDSFQTISEGKKDIIEKIKKEVGERYKNKGESLDSSIKDLIGYENKVSEENALISLRLSNLRKALEEKIYLDNKENELYEEEQILLKTIQEIEDKKQSVGEYRNVLVSVRDDLEKIDEEKKELINSTPEAYYGLHLKELKQYKKDRENGVIVETPYVKNQAEKIVNSLSAGQPVFIYGHLGSGKTELAMHVAKNYILKDRPDLDKKIDDDFKNWLEKNPAADKTEQEHKKKEFETIHKGAVVISGSKFLSLSEFYGHQVLKLDKNDEDDAKKLVEKVENEFKNWEKNNDQATEAEKNRKHDALVAAFIQNKSGTISDFYLGPIYKAMEEGRPVIIDEVNSIQHEVLISLNHILTRRPGDIVSVQQDSGRIVTVKDGFCVIMTGNLNTRKDVETYTDRKELDPAFLSRLYQIEQDYLPQRTEGTLDKDAGPDNQLFQIILSSVMDKLGNIELPKFEIKKLWNLALVAKETQEVFAGKLSHKFKQGGDTKLQASDILKKNVASIRAINRIVSGWQKSGMKYELDYYIWDEYISNASDPMERALLYQMFREKGFFDGEGWNKNPNYGAGGKLDNFEINPPKNRIKEFDFFSARECVNFAFGEGPKRTQWPNMKEYKKRMNDSGVTVKENTSSKKNEINFEQLQKIENESQEYAKKIEDLQKRLK